ncbi:Ig-like domain-containing protein [Heyndrickxia acidicola]|uniref:Ig-like domain-containing protein n=1 Tax=Heyndrickxia acidicola TaxID=209389 RepID=A0ABU6MFU2_9BACI|nr:Ig-like domain-containing protein [Heyndrickxia acidicola]MED1203283.1 Ig-like domain-containing protein [Heyndrickxia acidicola]
MAQSKSRKLVTGTISAAVIASALAPVAVSASVKAPNVKTATPLNEKQIKVVFDNGKTATITLPYPFKDGSTVTSFTYGGHYYNSVKLSTSYAPGVKTATATGPKQINVVFTDGVTKTIDLPYNFKAGSTVASFTCFGHSYNSVELSTPFVATVKSATAINENSGNLIHIPRGKIRVLFDNGQSATIALPYYFKDGSTVTSFTYADHYYHAVKLSTPYVATINGIYPSFIVINQGDDATKALPTYVSEVLSNNDYKGVNVTWDTTKLDVNTPATYTLTGKVDGIDKIASVIVVVKPFTPQATSVNAINSNNQAVTLDGSTDVTANSAITIKFNKPVDASTVNGTNFRIYQGSTPVATKAPTISADGLTVTVQASNPFTAGDSYILSVSGVKTQDGKTFTSANAAFTVNKASYVTKVDAEENDNTLLSNPLGLSDGDNLGSDYVNKFKVTYSNNVDFTSVSSRNVILYDFDASADRPVPVPTASVTSLGSVITLTVDPFYNGGTGTLIPNHRYKLQAVGVNIVDGTKAADFSRAFTISKPFGLTANLLDGTDLAKNPTNVNGTIAPVVDPSGYTKPGFKVVLNSNTPLDASTVNNTNIQLVQQDTQIAVPANITYDSANQRIAVVPKSDLTAGKTYSFSIGSGVKDVYGNAAKAVAYSFTTQN